MSAKETLRPFKPNYTYRPKLDDGSPMSIAIECEVVPRVILIGETKVDVEVDAIFIGALDGKHSVEITGPAEALARIMPAPASRWIDELASAIVDCLEDDGAWRLDTYKRMVAERAGVPEESEGA